LCDPCGNYGLSVRVLRSAKDPETIATERCDVLYGVPTMFIAQLNHPEFSRFDLGSLPARHHGRGSVPDRGDEGSRGYMHMSEITIAYGMTETSPVSSRAAATIRWSFVFRRSDGSSRISRSRSSTVTAASFRAAKPAELAPGDTRSCSVTGMTRSGRRKPSIRPAGCIQGTSRPSMRMDIAASWAGSRTW